MRNCSATISASATMAASGRRHRKDTSPNRPHLARNPSRRSLPVLPELCRFSDAGVTKLSTRSDSRRPKSAKARNRGSGAPTVQRALWGFGVGGSVGDVEVRLAIVSLSLESWVLVLGCTSGSHVARRDLRCDHGPISRTGASGGVAGREAARIARFDAVLDRR
jgi:hypothetical protein